jgi:RsiW-degrading membrane proteinase PrsW (M82 family)
VADLFGINIGSALVALAAGFIPAVIWLVFWLFEDRRRPEPRALVVRTFLVGMLAVPIVLPLEKIVIDLGIPVSFQLFLLWALIEEVVKLAFALFFVLRNSAALYRREVPNSCELDNLICAD